MTAAVEKSPQIKSQRHPLDATCINTIRTLSMDAVQAANSGHPGTPMAMAPVAYYLWQYVLRFDPEDPIWPNRDRFVLSAGHASMLLYSLLHLTGVKAVSKDYEPLGEPSVPLEEIKQFRQWHSRCPGHPEYRWTSGVETTTGPLGQGAANSVGMAAAERWMAARFNKPGFEKLIDFNVYALCGDGDMMEGITSEAASLAGHWKLSNLCWIYDNNHITIEGNTALAFSEDVATRFLGYGWNVTRVGDANDLDKLDRAFQVFLKETDRPTLIIVDSHIGWGAPTKQDTSAAHGEPLGEEEIRLTKRTYGWPEDAKFLVPDGVYDRFNEGIGKRGKQLRDAWFAQVDAVQGEASRPGRPALPDPAPAAPRRLGQGPAGLPGRPQGDGHPGLVGQGPQRDRQERPLADRRRRRPGPVDQDPLDIRRRRRLRGRQLRRPQLPLRHPRARDGGHHERHGPGQGPRLRLRVLDLQRLRPDADPPRGADGDPGHLRLHARLDRRRRRRPDPPADRAARLACGRSPA